MHVVSQDHSASPEFEADLAALQPQLRYFALSLTGSLDDAEEVVQNANRVAMEKAEDFTPGTNFKAWLFQIVNLQAKHFHRTRSRIRQTEIVGDSLIDTLSEPIPPGDPFEKERDALVDCLRQLRPEHQRLLPSRYVHDRRVNDLAVEEGVQPNALAQKLFRIRQKLAECIRKQVRTS